jgi:hypothetical protein
MQVHKSVQLQNDNINLIFYFLSHFYPIFFFTSAICENRHIAMHTGIPVKSGGEFYCIFLFYFFYYLKSGTDWSTFVKQCKFRKVYLNNIIFFLKSDFERH